MRRSALVLATVGLSGLLFGWITGSALIIGLASFGIVAAELHRRALDGFSTSRHTHRSPTSAYRTTRVEIMEVDIALHERWLASPAPLAILVHGWGSDSNASEVRAEPLVEFGCHVLLVDMPNHGMSGRMRHWSARRAAECVQHAIIAHSDRWPDDDITGVILYGHSMGGFVMLGIGRELMADLPHLLHGMVLESPMVSWPMVFEDRTSGVLLPLRRLLRWEIERDLRKVHPEYEPEDWDDASVPEWGAPCAPLLVIQAEEDDSLGRMHFDLLRQHAPEASEFVLDPALSHQGRTERGDAPEVIRKWISRILNQPSVDESE